MLLSCRILSDVTNVNSFEYSESADFTEGDSVSVYVQLIDTGKNRFGDGFKPPGRRYMPAVGASLLVTLDNVDDAKKYIKTATQPFPQDASIWKIDITSLDKVRGTVTVRLQLTEGTKVTKGVLLAGLRVYPAAS